MIRTLVLSVIAMCAGLGIARADLIETLSKTPDYALNGTDAYIDQVWDFTTLPGWNPSLPLISIEVTEDFTGLSGSPTFGSSITPYDTSHTNTDAAVFYLFGSAGHAVTLGTTEQVTFDIPVPVSLADLTNGATLGQFDTRVSRTTGSFTLSSMTVDLDFAPEPSTFVLLGAGLAGMVLLRRRFTRE